MNLTGCLFCAFTLVMATPARADEGAPISISGQRDEEIRASFAIERVLPPASGLERTLLKFHADGLEQYALMVTPDRPVPPAGFPVLIMNHGHVPEPVDYAHIEDGTTWRPGIYYRGLPTAYAQHGFLVIVPDFRGHNVSEGSRYASGFLASAWYTRDVLAAVAAVNTLGNADKNRVYMWGHSMGGEVSLRTLLSRADIRAASLWSTVYGSYDRQVYYYSMLRDDDDSDSLADSAESMNKYRSELAGYGEKFSAADTNPAYHTGLLEVPLIVHHARSDQGAPFQWSVDLVANLQAHRKPYRFFRYPGSDHLFKGDQRRLAVERDVAFFNHHPASPTTRHSK